MNIDKFLKDIVEGNIKSAVEHKKSKYLRKRSHEYHKIHNQIDSRCIGSYIIITLKNGEVYFVVPSTCCCPYVDFNIEEIESTCQCNCKEEQDENSK